MKTILLFAIVPLWLIASPLEVGPIQITGSGELSNPDYASYGGDGWAGLGVSFRASGTNGNDSVSINVGDIELIGDDFNQDVRLGTLRFDATATHCLVGFLAITDICMATIDGITGYGAFSNIGDGQGLIQVYAIGGKLGGWSYPGDLLAEAQVITRAQVTNVQYIGSQGHFNAMFDLLDPPADNQTPQTTIPEPGTWLIGTFLSFLFGCRHKRLTFPLTPCGAHFPHVTCLTCGREFLYSWKQMRIVTYDTDYTDHAYTHADYTGYTETTGQADSRSTVLDALATIR